MLRPCTKDKMKTFRKTVVILRNKLANARGEEGGVGRGNRIKITWHAKELKGDYK